MFPNPSRQFSTSTTLVLALILSLLVTFAPGGQPGAEAGVLSGNCELQALGASGNGSTVSPWGISTADQLWEVTHCPGNSFELLSDIDATNSTQSPIGTDLQAPKNSLIGVLDGKGFTISFSMIVSGPAALFNRISGAEIRNLTLSGTVQSNPSSPVYTGGLAISANGQNTISNVTSTLNIFAKYQVGGLIGLMEGSSALHVEDTKVTGALQAVGSGSFVGGFIGRANSSTVNILRSSSLGQISVGATVTSTGGFIGQAENSTVSIGASTRSSTIIAGQNSGGFIGVLSLGSSTLSGVTNLGNVTSIGNSRVGGLVGFSTATLSMVLARNSGNVSGEKQVGGLIGQTLNSHISLDQVLNEGAVSAPNTSVIQGIGGLVGEVGGGAALINSSNGGTISGGTAVGGLFGLVSSSPNAVLALSQIENFGPVSASGSAGGAIGLVNNLLAALNISGFTNSGNVTTSQRHAGGVIGRLLSPLILSGSANIATISSGTDFAGGAIGSSFPASGTTLISGFLNSGTIQAKTNAGGAVGDVVMVSGTRLELARTSNFGKISISGTTEAGAGGLIGVANQTQAGASLIQVVRSANFAHVDGGIGSAGGMVGRVKHGDTRTVINESFSGGSVQAGVNAGGLVASTSGALSISNSYSIASVSGTSNIGGLVGVSPGSLTLHNSYFGGALQISGTRDGIAQGTNAAVVTNSYSITDSRFVSASSIIELQSLATFVGWDFDDVWAFGACETNNRFPVLQWAETLYFDLSCLQIQTPTSSSQAVAPSPVVQQPSTPSSPVTSPAYSGPVVSSATMVVFRTETVVLLGKKLDAVTAAQVNGLPAFIVEATTTSITLRVPGSSSLGIQDLVLYSQFGLLTLVSALDVRERPVAPVVVPSQFGDLLGYQWSERFLGNARSLNQSQAPGFSLALGRFPGATTVVCWGYTTASNPSGWAIAHATLRARSVCSELAKLQPNLKTVVRVRTGVAKSAAMRASMQFWELKTKG